MAGMSTWGDTSGSVSFPCIGHGVFQSSGGNYYIMSRHVTNGDMEVWKSSDPTTGSWTQQDAANAPTAGSPGNAACSQNGDDLHAVYVDNSGTIGYQYVRFDMASDAWDAVGGASDYDDPIVISWTNEPDINFLLLGIVARSDDSLVVAYIGEKTGSMHSDTNKAQIAHIPYGSAPPPTTAWTVGTDLLASHAGDELVGVMVLGASDEVLITYKKSATAGAMFAKFWSTSDALGSEITCPTDADGNSGSFGEAGIYYDDGGTAVYAVPYLDDTATAQVQTFYIRGTTAQTERVVSDSGNHPGLNAQIGMAVKDKVGYVVWQDGTDIQMDSSDDEAAYGTDTAIDSETTTITALRCNYYIRSSRHRLAFIYQTSGQPYYDEYDLGAVGGGGIVARHPARRQPLIRH